MYEHSFSAKAITATYRIKDGTALDFAALWRFLDTDVWWFHISSRCHADPRCMHPMGQLRADLQISNCRRTRLVLARLGCHAGGVQNARPNNYSEEPANTSGWPIRDPAAKTVHCSRPRGPGVRPHLSKPSQWWLESFKNPMRNFLT